MLLYDMLLHLAPSSVTRLHRAIALRYTSGPRAAMSEVRITLYLIAAYLAVFGILFARRLLL